MLIVKWCIELMNVNARISGGKYCNGSGRTSIVMQMRHLGQLFIDYKFALRLKVNYNLNRNKYICFDSKI